MPRKPRTATETLHDAVRSFFGKLARPVERVTVAFSGGVDSTALLHALTTFPQRPFSLAAAHVNHALRGAESLADEAAARRFCEELGVGLDVLDGTLDPDRIRVRGVEAAARERRYAVLRGLRGDDGAHWIATAHQADDQAETLLLRLVTGRGPWRLAGIRPVHEGVIRPFLAVGRASVETYILEQRLAPRRDSSNDSPRFLRNRIRGEVLPLLRELNPRVVEHLGLTAELEQEREALLSSVLGSWFPVFERHDTGVTAPIARLPVDRLVRRMLVRAEIRALDPDERYLDAPALSRLDEVISGRGRARPTRAIEISSDGVTLEIRRLVSSHPPADYELVLEPGQTAEIGATGWVVSIGTDRGAGDTRAFVQEVAIPQGDPRAIVVRNRRRGDRFRPLGMRDEKKLSDYLIDRKIPKDIRDTLPLVLIDGRIAWIAGTGVSDDFRLGRGESGRLVLAAWRVGDDR